MKLIVQTEAFSGWLHGLRDRQARSRIHARIDRLRLGNAGDVQPVGGGVSELRLMFGPGYRRDIEAAQALWQEFKEDDDA